jgi:hypothetical protein
MMGYFRIVFPEKGSIVRESSSVIEASAVNRMRVFRARSSTMKQKSFSVLKKEHAVGLGGKKYNRASRDMQGILRHRDTDAGRAACTGERNGPQNGVPFSDLPVASHVIRLGMGQDDKLDGPVVKGLVSPDAVKHAAVIRTRVDKQVKAAV